MIPTWTRTSRRTARRLSRTLPSIKTPLHWSPALWLCQTVPQKLRFVNYDGFGLRVVYGYDITKKTDTISIDMLCGVKTLDKTLAVKLQSKKA